jgi:N-formylmaleamate deformylase
MKTLPVLGLLMLASMSAQAQSYSFGVKVVGSGKPMILIPGLACTGDVWNGTVDQLKAKFECHILTLPGFGRQAPIKGPYLSRVRDDIIAYVKNKKLNHPAVIGHSLGGFMVYYLAEAEPKLWGRLVSVDGLPFLGLAYNPLASAANMKPLAENIAKQLAAAKPDEFKAQIRASLAQEITDPKNVDAVNATACYSDQANVAEAVKELMPTDLRVGLPAIQSPLLVIGAGQEAKTDDVKKVRQDAYWSQIKTAPHASLKMAWKSRHFIMLDDPEFFYKTIEDFLAGS